MSKNRDKIINHLHDNEINADLNNDFDWRSDLPIEIVDWAYSEFDRMESECNLYYMDNLRVCDVYDFVQEQAYSILEQRGCCGCYYEELIGPDGIKYRLGCNYGH